MNKNTVKEIIEESKNQFLIDLKKLDKGEIVKFQVSFLTFADINSVVADNFNTHLSAETWEEMNGWEINFWSCPIQLQNKKILISGSLYDNFTFEVHVTEPK